MQKPLERKPPTAFISYSWDNKPHRNWVREFATKLRADGVDVTLDQWHAVPGDRLPEFMERSIRNSDFVIIICTPYYKGKSDSRTGGVGYEGDIITAEVLVARNQRKFIPVLRHGDWLSAAPSWLLGIYYVDLRGDYSVEAYQELLETLHGRRPGAPPIGSAHQGQGDKSSFRPVTNPPSQPDVQRGIEQAIREVENIIREAEVGIDITRVGTNLVRWKERTTGFIKNKIGDKEALQLASISASDFITKKQPRLLNEARLCRTYLLTLHSKIKG